MSMLARTATPCRQRGLDGTPGVKPPPVVSIPLPDCSPRSIIRLSGKTGSAAECPANGAGRSRTGNVRERQGAGHAAPLGLPRMSRGFPPPFFAG